MLIQLQEKDSQMEEDLQLFALHGTAYLNYMKKPEMFGLEVTKICLCLDILAVL